MHSFFVDVDWEKLRKKKIIPPFKPRVYDDKDLGNFSDEFTGQPVRDTPILGFLEN